MPAFTLEHIAAQLEAAGYAARARTIREAIRRLRDQHHTIENHTQEIANMARNFVEAHRVLLAHDAAETADNSKLATANADLTAKLADALTKVPTQDVLDAQQAVIDAAEKISPSVA